MCYFTWHPTAATSSIISLQSVRQTGCLDGPLGKFGDDCWWCWCHVQLLVMLMATVGNGGVVNSC